MSRFVADITNEIIKNLEDRYSSAQQVLKELIQNADDAASLTENPRLAFGCHPGFGDQIDHPLLNGPALWFFNNCNFGDNDKKNIASFGINSKAGDSSKIGKFGLGMKSVFHLTEAFLYVALRENKPFAEDMLNPWDDGEPNHPHAKWSQNLEIAWECLRDFARKQMVPTDLNGFLLWIPLRSEKMLAGASPLVDHQPGNPGSKQLEFIAAKELPENLAALLAMLPHLERISYIDPNYGFDIRHQRHGSLGRLRLLGNNKDKNNQFAGQIVGTASPLHISALHNCQEEEAKFLALRNDEAWPHKFYNDPKTKKKNYEADKSNAEGAVVITHCCSEKEELTVSWAVFLPLEKHCETFPIPGVGKHWRITLHGQFFIDAGRQGIAGLTDNFRHANSQENDLKAFRLQHAWNKSIAEELVLPSILPALAHHVVLYRISDNETTLLSKAMHSWIKQHDSWCHQICSAGTWARVIEPTGSTWCLLPTGKTPEKIRSLPQPPASDLKRPWDVFSELETLGVKFVQDDNDISPISQLPTQWSEEEIAYLLRTMDMSSIATKSGHLDYLNEVLTLFRPKHLPRARRDLQNSLRTAFSRLGLSGIRKNGKKLAKTIEHLGEMACFPLGVKSTTENSAILDAIFQSLWKVDADLLLVPGDLVLQPVKRPTLPDAVLERWLNCLQPLLNDQELMAYVLDASSQLLDGLEDKKSRALFVKNHPELRILAAKRPQDKEDTPLCLREIERYHGKKSLFSTGSATDKYELLSLLVRVLPEQDFFLITPNDQEIAFGKTLLPKADSHLAILESIGKYQGQLGSLEDRKKLVAQINLPAPLPNEALYGMRFLLHGCNERWNNDAFLWKADGHLEAAWAMLWKDLQQFRGIEEWQIINPELAAELRINDAETKSLRIKSVAHAELIAQFTGLDLTKLDGKRYSRQDREEILAGIQEEKLWRNLPFHEYENGHVDCISKDSVRLSTLSPPGKLRDRFQLIRLAEHEALRKRQEREIPELDHQRLAASIFKETSPQDYIHLLLDALETLDDTAPPLVEWRSFAWLRLYNGTVIAPNHLLDINGLDDELKKLAAKVNYQFAPLSLLSPDIQEHRQFSKLKAQLILSAEESFQRLPHFLQGVPGYGIGHSVNTQHLATALSALTQLEELPAWRLLAEAAKSAGKPIESARFEELNKPLNPETLIAVCNRLAEMEGDSAKLAHTIYLQQFACHEETDASHLKRLRLRAQNGELADAVKLCHGAANVTSASLLHDEQAKILAQILRSTNDYEQSSDASSDSLPNLELLERSATGVLEQIFRKWDTRVRPALIGVFLTTLGKPALGLANRYLSKTHYNFESINKKLNTTEQVSDCALAIRTVRGAINFPNLVGDVVPFPQAVTLGSLIAGAPRSVRCAGRRYLIIEFIQLDTAKFEDQELKRILLRSAQEILGKHNPILDSLWGELGKSEQLDVAVTRKLVLKHLPDRLKRLGLDAHPVFFNALNQFRQKESEWGKIKVAEDGGYTIDRNKRRIAIEKETESLQLGLERALENDPKAQAAVLAAIRGKIEEYSYTPDSILFELFQNADDAAIELANCEIENEFEVPVQSQSLIVQLDDGFVRLAHFGRRINWEPASLHLNSLGYVHDLEKMLNLQGSDKAHQKGKVTGHFGLGFKSVFLACETPRLLSDAICTEIRGGILPCTWNSAEAAKRLLQRYTKDRNYPGTVIELPIDPSMAKPLLDRFEKLAGLLVVFSRAIRRITFEINGDKLSLAWSPEEIIPDIEVGRVAIPGLPNNGMFLVVRTSVGSIGMSLGAAGPIAFDAKKLNLPSIWVTAPTAEYERLGYAINGTFAIDAGRGGLARQTDKNLDNARTIGKVLGETLAKYFSHQNERGDWDLQRSALGLADDCTCAQFWAELWKTLSLYPLQESSGAHVADIARELVLIAFNTWCDLVHTVPNGQPGKHAKFIEDGQNVRELQKNWNAPAVLDAIQKIPEKDGTETPFLLVSEPIADLLRKSGRQKRISPFDTTTLLRMTMPDDRCSPEQAAALERVVISVEQGCEEAFDRTPLTKLKFLNARDAWVPTQYVLCLNEKNPEEALRYALSPPENRLHQVYSDSSLAFFLRSRGDFQADAESLAAWVRNCQKPAYQTAALRYISKGALASEVVKKLRPYVSACWLNAVKDEHHPAMQELDEASMQEVLRHLIPFAEIRASNWFQAPIYPSLPPRKKGKAALQAIDTWWNSEGRRLYRQRYLENLYPKNQLDASGCLIGLHLDDGVNRRAWMTLFSIAIFQRLGRVRDFQSRGFVEAMDSWGCWAILCECDPNNNSEAWIGVLRDFAERQTDSEQYDYWLDSFPRLFKVANWLEAYVDIFEGINFRQRDELNPMLLLSPNTDPAYQGSGFAAPPLVKTMKKGVHLLIRELLRAGVLKNQVANSLAFMPAKRVLRLFEEIELPQDSSETIWRTLCGAIGPEKAVFGRDFDMPLLILAEQPVVLNELLQIDLSNEDDESEFMG